MNKHDRNRMPRRSEQDTEHLDSDLIEISRLLDRLGSAEADSSTGDLNERVAAAGLGALHGVVETSAQVSELGARERASAPRDLETHVFDASRKELGAAPVRALRLAGTTASESGRVVVVRRSWARLAVAACLAIVAGAGAWVMLRPASTGTVQLADGTARVAEQLQQEMDTLFQALDDSPVATTRERETEFDPAWLDDWLKEGAS